MLDEILRTAIRDHKETIITAKKYINLFINDYRNYRRDLIWEFRLIKDLNILHKLKYVRIQADEDKWKGDVAGDEVSYIFDNTLTEDESLALWELDTIGASLRSNYDKFKAAHSEWFNRNKQEAIMGDEPNLNYMLEYGQKGCSFKKGLDKGKYLIRTFAKGLDEMEYLLPNANDE